MPAGVVLPARTVNVTEPEPFTEVEERLAAKPPFTLRLTGPLNPFRGETVMVLVLLLPRPAVISRDAGEADRLKSPGCGGGGGAFTVRETLVVCTSMPLVALMVILLVPTGVEAAVQTVRVEDPAPVTEAGLKLALALAGSALPRLRLTVLLKPLTSADTEAV